MIIRAAKAADAEVIGQLWLQLTEYHRKLDKKMPVPAADGALRYARRIENTLDDNHTRVFVAEVDGKVVGYVLGLMVELLAEVFESERSGFLADIYVMPEYRGQGTGRALVNALKSWFRGRGVNYFEWHVASSNKAGVAFWKAINGKEVVKRMRLDIDKK